MVTDPSELAELARSALETAEERLKRGGCNYGGSVRGFRDQAELAVAEVVQRFWICPSQILWISNESAPMKSYFVIVLSGLESHLLVEYPDHRGGSLWRPERFWLQDMDAPEFRPRGKPLRDLADLGARLAEMNQAPTPWPTAA